jgi:hypothetical protein
MYKNEEVHPWYGVGDCSWKYVYKVDHKEREQQLAWHTRSYDKHEKASLIGRERMLGGKIETVFSKNEYAVCYCEGSYSLGKLR